MLFACPDFVSGTDAEADADAARFCFCSVGFVFVASKVAARQVKRATGFNAD